MKLWFWRSLNNLSEMWYYQFDFCENVELTVIVCTRLLLSLKIKNLLNHIWIQSHGKLEILPIPCGCHYGENTWACNIQRYLSLFQTKFSMTIIKYILLESPSCIILFSVLEILLSSLILETSHIFNLYLFSVLS